MIVVVPARGGSRRVPRKNIQPLGGRPLLAWTLAVAREALPSAALYVSTDDAPIADVARAEAGVQVVMRPPELASDSASTEGVLLHVLDTIEAAGEKLPEWLMTLPPTSPFRTAATLRRFAEATATLAADVDCLMSTTENRGDFWLAQPDGSMRRLFPDAPRRQQDRTPLFEENSCIYVTRVRALRETGFILGRRVAGVAISQREGFDINTPEDFALAERLLS